MTIYGILCFFFYPLIIVIGQSKIGKRRGSTNIPRRESLGAMLARLVGVSLLPLVAIIDKPHGSNLPAGIVGTLLIMAGIAISLSAQWALGKNWVGGIGLHKRHRLVQAGPYRYVRHPLYTGMIVSSIGIGIAGWSILLGLAALGTYGGLVFRVRGEEELLKRRFPKQYNQYTQTTGMLFPRFGK